ncbi:MAG: FHA domain-containing protein [Planctomycetota bacterium]|nr:FHA domain-containing protein [Planctomycetota bacterium]
MADIIISNNDLKDPSIDDMINLQKSLQPQGGEKVEDVKTPFYLNPIFYYAVAAALAGLSIWAICEPYIDDTVPDTNNIPFVGDYLLFGPVAGALSLALGIVYGLSNRNLKQAAFCGVVGLGIGLLATMLTTIVADILFGITQNVAVATINVPPGGFKEGEFPFKGISFFILMCGRGIAWSIISMGSGLGLGIALKSKKLTLNGLVGGMIGGLLGGLFFDPIGRFLVPPHSDAWMSRFVGFLAVCTFVGLFIGFFENISKEAWFQMVKGPLAGKHFIIFKNPMRIGSSPKSDIYLFKDPDVAPTHATVVKSGARYMLQDENSEKGVFVNGRKVEKHVLQPSDTVTIGETVLRYHEKQRGS